LAWPHPPDGCAHENEPEPFRFLGDLMGKNRDHSGNAIDASMGIFFFSLNDFCALCMLLIVFQGWFESRWAHQFFFFG
jgi:hypothetical protein